jgi:F0F1-type ATP synthase assembly protein I
MFLLSGDVPAQLRARPSLREGEAMKMIRQSILMGTAVAVAIAFLPPSAFAKKSHKAKEPP